MKTSSKLATLAGGLALALTTLAAPAAMAAPFAPKPAMQFAQNRPQRLPGRPRQFPLRLRQPQIP